MRSGTIDERKGPSCPHLLHLTEASCATICSLRLVQLLAVIAAGIRCNRGGRIDDDLGDDTSRLAGGIQQILREIGDGQDMPVGSTFTETADITCFRSNGSTSSSTTITTFAFRDARSWWARAGPHLGEAAIADFVEATPPRANRARRPRRPRETSLESRRWRARSSWPPGSRSPSRAGPLDRVVDRILAMRHAIYFDHPILVTS